MEHISEVIARMMASGKFGNNEKPTGEVVNQELIKALLFAVFANHNQADLNSLSVCDYLSEQFKDVENKYTGLIPYDLAVAHLFDVLVSITNDEDTSLYMTAWFTKAYAELDHREAINFYRMKKYLLKKEDIKKCLKD